VRRGALGPSFKGRLAAAIALTVGFYALAIAIAAALLAVAIVPWIGGHGNPFISITALVLAGSIAVAVAPRHHRFTPPGVRITRESQPRLVALVEDEAAAAGEPPPDEIYVTFEVNAAVTEAGRGRRVLIVGLLLLHLVSERGLRSVIAHELGHYAGGDTRLGSWLFRTRAACNVARRSRVGFPGPEGETPNLLSLVRLPSLWYGLAFLRITNAISRRQEFSRPTRARRAGRVATSTSRRCAPCTPTGRRSTPTGRTRSPRSCRSGAGRRSARASWRSHARPRSSAR
jgi:heat shock protein HtpX